MYIDHLTVTDFRCFGEKLEVALRRPASRHKSAQHNVTVLLGVNGVGKTSLLQAIALGVLNESLRDTGLLFRNLVCRASVGGEATLTANCWLHGPEDVDEPGEGTVFTTVRRHLSGDAPMFGGVKLPHTSDAESRSRWERMMLDKEARSFFLVGYGAQRRPSQAALFDLGRQDSRYHRRAQRVASLFVDDLKMIPLAAWWPRSKAKAEVQALLEAVLPEELTLTEHLDESGELLVKFRGVELPETALSDGYRAFLGWFGDLLYRLTQVQRPEQKLTSLQGVVLVDEIDLHLHPSWQQSVIDRVALALPALQFIVTTHSPLIVGGVRRESLRVLQVGDAGEVTISTPEEETYGRTADQILLSDSFGLTHVRPAAFVEQLEAARSKMKAGDIDSAVQYTRMLALGDVQKASP